MRECVCGVKEGGEGYDGTEEKEKEGGGYDKGSGRDAEHEAGLDRTIGLRVTFELSSAKRLDCGFVGKDLKSVSFLLKNKADLRIKPGYTQHYVISLPQISKHCNTQTPSITSDKVCITESTRRRNTERYASQLSLLRVR